jgi:Na+/H+ antiporter NhaD/arsenite permease-like protein
VTYLLLMLIFLGFLSIVVEDLIHVDKAKTTLFFGSFVWVLYFAFLPSEASVGETNHALNENLLDIATLWLFLVAAMTFVVYLSSKGIIEGIVNSLLPERLTEKKLMLITGLFAFLFSSMADNITATLVCLSVLLSLNLPPEKLLRFVVLVVFAVNSGGVSLITGDVTTLMIFLAEKVSILNLLWLSIPSLLAVLMLVLLLSWNLKGELVFNKKQFDVSWGDKVIALLFLATILGTIAGNIVFGIPPVLSFLFGLSLMFMVVQFINKDEPMLDYVRRIEFDTLLFFLGVLLLVGMLKQLHVLELFPQLYDLMPVVAANYVLGLASALLDNVPLTAALLKSGVEMDLASWMGLTYAVGVGGSLLVIGSAAGVVAMSKLEALTFGAYLRFFLQLIMAFTFGYGAVLLMANFIF